jgi:hypothetical protein
MKGQLKKEVARRMLFAEEDFSKNELEIIDICEDILLARLDDLKDREKEISRLAIELKNKDIELKDLKLEFIRKKPGSRDWD